MANSKKRHVVRIPALTRRHLYVQRKVAIALLVFIFAIAFALCITTIVHADLAIPQASNQFYVNDFANIFNDDQTQEMLDRAVALANKPEGIQVVVTTVKSLEGMSIEDYANKMYNQFEIGKDDKGVLILLSTGERQIRVEVGYGLESYLTDSKTGQFIDKYAIGFLKNNQFDIGLMNLQIAIVGDLDSHFENVRADETTDASSLKITEEPDKRTNPIVETELDTRTIGNEVIDSEQENASNYYGIMALIGWLVAIAGSLGFVVQSVRYSKSENNRDYESNQYDQKLGVKDSEIYSLRREKMQLETELDGASSQIYKLQSNCIKLSNQVDTLQKNLEFVNLKLQKEEESYQLKINQYRELMHKYEIAQEKHPGLDVEVEERIKEEIEKAQMDKAEQFNLKLRSAIRLSPVESNLSEIADLSNSYNGFDEGTKRFVNSDMMATLLKLLEEVNAIKKQRLLREEAERKRKAEEERKQRELEEAKRRREEQERRKKEEERRKKEEEERRKRRKQQEEEEERRRMRLLEEERRRHDSSNSFNSSSHFGGFGGHSGGGGASRGF